MTRLRAADLTPGTITKVILPVIYAGASLRLLALLRESEDPAVREMGIALAAVAAAGSTLAPGVLRSIEDIAGDANYGRFLSQLGTVVAAGSGDAVLLRSAYCPNEADPKVRARRRRMLGTLTVMGVLFSRDRATAAELQVPTDRLYTPMPALYWLVFSDYMVLAAGEVAQLAFRTSRLTREESLRGGLRCVGAGALILSGFYGQYATGVVGRVLSPRLPSPLRGVPAQAVIGTAGAVIAVGASLPGAMWRWRAMRQHFEDTRRCIGLSPVWRLFRRGDPKVTLPVGIFGGSDIRLFRRVIEILDGLDRITNRRDPSGRIHVLAESAGRDHGLDPEQVTALERAGLIRYATDYSPANGDADRHGEQKLRAVPLTGTAVHEDYREEARRLLRTAQYLRNSPLPRLIAEHVHESDKHQRGTMNAMPSDKSDPHGPRCSCLTRASDDAGYLAYAVGRTECDKFLEQERARCPVHGNTSLAKSP